MKKNAVLGATVVALSLLGLSGCGGAKPQVHAESRGTTTVMPEIPGDARSTGRVTIQWPRASRLVPLQTNRFVLFVNAEDIHGTYAYVIDRPAGATSSVVDIHIPAGEKRLISAEARNVTNILPGAGSSVTGVQSPLPLDDLRLFPDTTLGGDRLATGNNDIAQDITAGQTIPVGIELRGPTGQGTVTDVNLKISQVIPTSFPSVLSVQIIRDQNGQPVSDLTPANFEVYEDGVPAVITDVRTVEQSRNNIDLMLVLDRSGSMSGSATTDLENAATQFLTLLQPEDRGAVINFASGVQLTQGFTADQSLLVAAIQGQFVNGSTALYDALKAGVDYLAQESVGRRAVIGMTDGQDNNSFTSTQGVINAAQNEGIPIFMVGLGSVSGSTLQRIADETGGLYYATPDSRQLLSIYQSIGNQLRQQVQLSFISPRPQRLGIRREVRIVIKLGSLTSESTNAYIL